MEQIQIYLLLFGIIVVVGQVFSKSPLPISLILVITGMILSTIPGFPVVTLNPDLVLNVFLPILLYQISSFSSWKDIRKHLQPIVMLSIGHVIFITFLVAILVHTMIPQLDWALCFVLGAVISPPDDVAIVSIAEKIRLPSRIVTILEGEGMLNDATALTLFRFALAAVITHQFFIGQAIITFIGIVIGETLYGVILGNIIGELRLKIRNPVLHIIASILTPFLAYLPAEMLGGSGIIATVVTGFVIGHSFSSRFSPEYRLISFALWPAFSFAIQSILFLSVGLDIRSILERISSISPNNLAIYSMAVIFTVILGRFVWVYGFVAYLPRRLIFNRMKNPYPSWQYTFFIFWAGMRGGISLAAALAVPLLPSSIEGANPRDLLIFLVFTVIIATFVLQGLTLPWLVKKLGLDKHGEKEQYDEHLAELYARLRMTKAALRWLKEYKTQLEDDPKLINEVKLYIREYKMLKAHLKESIKGHSEDVEHDEHSEVQRETFLLNQIIEVERSELLRLWRMEQINLAVRNKLLARLDHSAKHLPE